MSLDRGCGKESVSDTRQFASAPQQTDRAWLEENREKVGAFYLPSYNPELNPDERGLEARDQQQGAGSREDEIESSGKQLHG